MAAPSSDAPELEAHFAHTPGLCGLAITPDGRRVMTCGSDGLVKVYNCSLEDVATHDHHEEGVNAIAVSVDGKHLATASDDFASALFTLPACEFDANLTRLTQPALAVAFSPTTALVAVAGEERDVRLVDTSDTVNVVLLSGHDGAVKHVAFSPNGELLCSTGCDGTVRIWNIALRAEVARFGCLPRSTDPRSSLRGAASFSPDSSQIALPGTKDLVIAAVEGDKKQELTGGHSEPISLIAWSPDGSRIASVSTDGMASLWSVPTQGIVRRVRLAPETCALAWLPNGTAIYAVDMQGNVRCWDDVGAPATSGEEEDRVASAATIGQRGAGSEQTSGSAREETRPRQRAASGLIEDEAEEGDDSENDDDHGSDANSGDDDDVDLLDGGDDESAGSDIGSDGLSGNEDDKGDAGVDAAREARRAERAIRRERRHDRALAPSHGARARVLVPQPFQPGESPRGAVRRLLAYNAVGLIATVREDSYSSVDIEFADAARRRVRFTDHFGFTMAALGNKGALFGSPATKAQRATLFFRPFDSWAPNAEWSLQLDEGEDILCVAVCDVTVAVYTSRKYLRLLSFTGVQRDILSLANPVVTMCGWKNTLAVVAMDASTAALAGHPSLRVTMYECERAVQTVASCPCPLSAPAHDRCFDAVLGSVEADAEDAPVQLTWLGFSEIGSLCTMDSVGVLRTLVEPSEGQWTPAFDPVSKPELRDERRKGFRYWPIAVTDTSLVCILLKGAEEAPATLPRPPVSIRELSVPLASSGRGAALETEIATAALRTRPLERVVRKARLSGASAEDCAAEDEALLEARVAADRAMLQLIDEACRRERLTRALDLTRFLNSSASVEAAMKIAAMRELHDLAERMSFVLESKLDYEEDEEERFSADPTQVVAVLRQQAGALRRLDRRVQSHAGELETVSAAVMEIADRHGAGGSDAEDDDADDDCRAEYADGDGAGRSVSLTTNGAPRRLSGSRTSDEAGHHTDDGDGAKRADKRPRLVQNPFATSIADLQRTKGATATGTVFGAIRTAKSLEREEQQALEDEERERVKERQRAVGEAGRRVAAASAGSGAKPKQQGSRPPSSYMLFANDIRAKIVEENPGLRVTEVARLIGERWRELSEEQRRPYIARAHALRNGDGELAKVSGDAAEAALSEA